MSAILKVSPIFLLIVVAFSKADENDAFLPTPAIQAKYGYGSETHSVTTSDGYILTIHRIPPKKPTNRVAFLQHGILCSSADWVLEGPDYALGLMLADHGYDVWMGNARGNTYSKNHTNHHPKSKEFWQFSWHEIGIHDLPAMIDYVLEQTGQESLYYVGHSQGTTSFYVMCSERPEYNKKIRAHISLAPIAYMNHMTSPLLHFISFFTGPAEMLLNLIGMNEFLPSTKFLNKFVGHDLCGNSIFQGLCENALFVICGFSPKEMNSTLLPSILGHVPAGASTKQFLHYGQEIISGYFRQYDHGMLGNLRKYGRLSPPSYNLKKVTAPVYLLHSLNDWLAGEEDVYRLYKQLGNPKGRILVSDTGFNHLDYLYGINAPSLVYTRVVSLLSRH